jgi:hypothetical protein
MLNDPKQNHALRETVGFEPDSVGKQRVMPTGSKGERACQ